MRTCSVPGCRSTKINSKVTLYKVPCDKKTEWELAVRSVHNKQCIKLKNLKFVCSKHFLDDEIISTYELPSDVAEASEFLFISLFIAKNIKLASLGTYCVKNIIY